jgi:hypothetical protein
MGARLTILIALTGLKKSDHFNHELYISPNHSTQKTRVVGSENRVYRSTNQKTGAVKRSTDRLLTRICWEYLTVSRYR